MAVRIWLQQGHDGGPGVEALALDLLGFSTWARSETEVVEKLPAKLREYSAWRARHRIPIEVGSFDVEIVGRFEGDEILLPPDLEPARAEEIDLTIRLLACSRGDLLAELEAAPEGAIDWDPPYEHFAPWASWRTIRANLAHVANGETHYYARNIGHTPLHPPADPGGDWRDFLPRSRGEAVAFLEALESSDDLRRIRTVNHGFGDESWSVRKALRRIVSHELLHTKSIAGSFASTGPGSPAARHRAVADEPRRVAIGPWYRPTPDAGAPDEPQGAVARSRAPSHSGSSVVWVVHRFEIATRELDFTSAGLGKDSTRVLLSDGVTIVNALEYLQFDADLAQTLVCEQCGTPGCGPRSWVCFRSWATPADDP